MAAIDAYAIKLIQNEIDINLFINANLNSTLGKHRHLIAK